VSSDPLQQGRPGWIDLRLIDRFELLLSLEYSLNILGLLRNELFVISLASKHPLDLCCNLAVVVDSDYVGSNVGCRDRAALDIFNISEIVFLDSFV